MGYIYKIPSSPNEEPPPPPKGGAGPMSKINPMLLFLAIASIVIGSFEYSRRNKHKLEQATARSYELQTQLAEMNRLRGTNEELKKEIAEKEQIEHDLRKQLRMSSRFIKPGEKPEITYGLISSILYSGVDTIAVIDGEIMREGDTLYGIRIVKILRNEIEFAKDRRRWSQRLGESPPEIWTEHLP